MKKDKNLRYYRKQIYKPPLQFSGLCGTTFVSYLFKRFTQLRRVLYGDAMLVDQIGRSKRSTSMAAGNRTKTSGVHFAMKALTFLS